MRESIKVIKFCGATALIFLVLTYIATVNLEASFISVDSVWISNNFFIAIFGGAFASTLVVGLCEFHKYLSLKANTEQYLFFQGFYLYQALMQMKTIVETYLDHCEWPLTGNLLDESIRTIQCEINALEATDYASFRHRENSLMNDHNRFRRETLPIIQPLLQSGLRLKLAISETEREYMQKQFRAQAYSGSSKRVTSKCQRVSQALNDELKTITLSAELVDDYITALDKHCHNRFKWEVMKEKLVFPCPEAPDFAGIHEESYC